MQDDSPNAPAFDLIETIFVLFLRLVAVSCLWFGLEYWAMLVGYSHQGLGRFDLLSLPWRTAATSLAIAFPVSALGLWLASSWGPVVWLLAASTQMLMFTVWAPIFGQNKMALLMHGAVAGVYVLFRLVLWLRQRRKRQVITIHSP